SWAPSRRPCRSARWSIGPGSHLSERAFGPLLSTGSVSYTDGVRTAPEPLSRRGGTALVIGGTGGVHGEEHGPAAASPDPLATVPDAVCHLDRSWRFTYVNARVAAMAHRRPAELLGRPLQDCFPGVRGSVLEDRFREAL